MCVCIVSTKDRVRTGYITCDFGGDEYGSTRVLYGYAVVVNRDRGVRAVYGGNARSTHDEMRFKERENPVVFRTSGVFSATTQQKTLAVGELKFRKRFRANPQSGVRMYSVSRLNFKRRVEKWFGPIVFETSSGIVSQAYAS